MISSCASGCSIIIRLNSSRAFRQRCVGQRVGRIGVGHQQDIGESLAHFANHLHIPAGLDLHLDALVSGRQFGFDFLQKLRDGILDSDGNAARNLAPRPAADVLIKRLAKHARFQIPNRDFQAAPRHQVAADVRAACPDIGRMLEIVMQHARSDVIAQDQPRRFGPFFVVKRIFAAGDLAPA